VPSSRERPRRRLNHLAGSIGRRPPSLLGSSDARIGVGSLPCLRLLAPRDGKRTSAPVTDRRPGQGTGADLRGRRIWSWRWQYVLSAHGFVATTSVGLVGVIAIDERSCMVCGRCAPICLTTPLKLRQLDSALEVTFDSVMCVGCSMRLTTYTERENGAIMLRTSFDVRQPHRGRHTDCSSSTSRREICQVRLHTRPCSMLGPHHRGDHRSQGRRCVGCR
jgi:hypothetical protein